MALYTNGIRPSIFGFWLCEREREREREIDIVIMVSNKWIEEERAVRIGLKKDERGWWRGVMDWSPALHAKPIETLTQNRTKTLISKAIHNESSVQTTTPASSLYVLPNLTLISLFISLFFISFIRFGSRVFFNFLNKIGRLWFILFVYLLSHSKTNDHSITC